MQEEEIKGYIDKLNKDEYEDTLFLRQVNKSAEVARFWEEVPVLTNLTK